MIVSELLQSWLVENEFAVKTWTDDALWQNACQKALDAGKLTPAKFAELQKKAPTARDVFGGSPRVKRPSERYSNSKSVALHTKSGKPVRDERGRQVETVSQLEMAKAGALLKRIAQKSGLPVEMTEHDNQLLEETFASDTWCGKVGSEYRTDIDGTRVKTLINDSTSGGVNVVPIWFDNAVIQFPLLNSELLPMVDLVDVPRGSTVNSGSIGNPTAFWGTGDGTPISPFDTSSLVAALDTDIHPVSVAVEIGRDFMSDSPVDVGRILLENIGQRMLAELDRVIVKGNGTTEPQGIFNASGLVDIGNPAGGNGATAQVNDYETLLFGIGKQYRRPEYRPAFIASDVSYRRARSIPVGTNDARRVFGMDEQSYMLLNVPFLIQADVANNYAAFAAMAKYRLYRRQAQEVRFTDQGKELMLRNQNLLVVRGRFGGRVMDANAFAFSDNWQA
jgi:HK97 family phage major capsid protein